MACALASLLILSCNIQNEVERTVLPDYFKIHTTPTTGELSIKYYGIGCTLISYKGKSVLTDPALSNPSLFNVVAGKLKTDEALIELLNPKLSQVNFTVIGHAHYDHLMDLPYLSKNHIPANAKTIGSKTAANILYAAKIPQEFIVANNNNAASNMVGKWVYNEDKSLRIMPIEASHLPQIASIINLAPGVLEKPLNKVPERAKDWLAGQTFNYLIDFLGTDNTIEKRVFFQSTTDSPGSGMVPENILNEHKIDVALLAGGIDGANLEETNSYLNAENYLLIHWENFFRSKLLEAKPMSTSHNKLLEFIKQKGWQQKVIHPSLGQLLNY